MSFPECPPGYIWDPNLQRCACNDFEIKAAALAHTEKTAGDIEDALGAGWAKYVSLYRVLARLSILLTPKEFLHFPGNQNLILYPSPLGYTVSTGGTPVDIANPDTNEADTARIRKQLDAVVSASYAYIDDSTEPTPLLRAIASLLFALAGTMLELPQATAWPPFELDQGAGPQVENFVRLPEVKAVWEAASGQVVEGVDLRKSEVLTALAGKLKPWLEHTVHTTTGEQQVDTFRLLMAFINIVAERYELTSDT